MASIYRRERREADGEGVLSLGQFAVGSVVRVVLKKKGRGEKGGGGQL